MGMLKYYFKMGQDRFLFFFVLHFMMQAIQPIRTSHNYSIYSKVFLNLGVALVSAYTVESIAMFFRQSFYPKDLSDVSLLLFSFQFVIHIHATI
jgi:hypothetical protein